MSNVSKAIPSVEIELGGQSYKLVFSLECFCLVEDITGKSLVDGDVLKSIDVRTITAIVWAAMQTFHPEVTLKEVRQSLGLSDVAILIAKIGEGFTKAMPPEEKKSGEAGQ